MQRPRVRLSVRWLMSVVAVAALASLAASGVCRNYPSTEQRAVFLTGSVVAGAFGLGATRRPLVSLALLLMIWVAVPSVDHPGIDVLSMTSGGCYLGWIIGAPAGWISR